eukprot:1546815-Rhodomonas_salina.1
MVPNCSVSSIVTYRLFAVNTSTCPRSSGPSAQQRARREQGNERNECERERMAEQEAREGERECSPRLRSQSQKVNSLVNR